MHQTMAVCAQQRKVVKLGDNCPFTLPQRLRVVNFKTSFADFGREIGFSESARLAR